MPKTLYAIAATQQTKLCPPEPTLDPSQERRVRVLRGEAAPRRFARHGVEVRESENLATAVGEMFEYVFDLNAPAAEGHAPVASD